MNGVLAVIDMLGNTIAELRAQIEELSQQNARLTEMLQRANGVTPEEPEE